LLYRVNAGRLPTDHWLNDPVEGGGRLVGEGCHFIDFACWVVGALPARVTAHVRPEEHGVLGAGQSFVAGLEFADGSLASILYSADGASGAGKEYVEAHAGGRSAILDEYKRLELFDGSKRRRLRLRGGDKGHSAEFAYLRRVLAGEAEEDSPAPLDTMLVTLSVRAAAESGSCLAPAHEGPQRR